MLLSLYLISIYDVDNYDFLSSFFYTCFNNGTLLNFKVFCIRKQLHSKDTRDKYEIN